MAARLSRRKIAAFVADSFIKDSSSMAQTVQSVAAYLVDTRRTREIDLLVRDIEDALATRGIVIADVTSAHPLTSTLKDEIARLVGGDSLQLREAINPMLIGGIRIDVPGKRFDGTVRRKLTALKAQQ